MKHVQNMSEKEKDALKEVVYEMLTRWEYSINLNIDFTQSNPNRDFYIQFTAITWDKEHKEWRLKCLIEGIGSELIYCPNVQYKSKTGKDVKLKSWKNNWDKFRFFFANEPNQHDIPLYLLYSDFKWKEYTGTCWMR